MVVVLPALTRWLANSVGRTRYLRKFIRMIGINSENVLDLLEMKIWR